MFIVALFLIAYNWKQPKVHQQVNKQIVVHQHNVIILSNKKEQIVDAFITRINVKIILQSKRNQALQNSVDSV